MSAWSVISHELFMLVVKDGAEGELCGETEIQNLQSVPLHSLLLLIISFHSYSVVTIFQSNNCLQFPVK